MQLFGEDFRDLYDWSISANAVNEMRRYKALKKSQKNATKSKIVPNIEPPYSTICAHFSYVDILGYI